ncbi:MAG: SCP2 sterol-binding domain-containing protein [Deltaproteobacteria bacterium]|jgi:hypothetical protein|nr:SCP2 sterol-binding domain-containing protein [Deltaproteobacteria bacterium]
MTIEELFTRIQAKSESVKFNDSLSALIHIDIKGVSGGGDQKWLVSLANGRAQLASGEAGVATREPDVSVALKETTLLSLASREMAPLKAFLLGRVKVKGDISLLGQLKYLWPES